MKQRNKAGIAKDKITTLNEAAEFSRKQKNANLSVGLVVGSFDILHLGHTNLFQLAKKNVDYLIVGLDNDKTIRLVKGKNRPINNYKNRSELLAEMSTVDKIFLINKTSHHDSEEALDSYELLVKKIMPTHIFTHRTCDRHWKQKRELAKKYAIQFVLDKGAKITHSGEIIRKLGF